MSKRIVVGLDPSPHGEAAVTLACGRAMLFGGTVIAVGVVDTKAIERSAAGSGVGAGKFARDAEEHHLESARTEIKRLMAEFEKRATGLGVAYETVVCDGDPVEEIIARSYSADLLVIGSRTHFHFETSETEHDALKKILSNRACPVMIVPENVIVPERVVFPYDGSVEAAHAMRLFHYYTQTIPMAQELILLNVNDDAGAGAAVLQPAETFLRAHGRSVRCAVADGRASDRILQFAKAADPCVVVLGSSTKGLLERLVFGGVTDALLRDGGVLLFVAG